MGVLDTKIRQRDYIYNLCQAVKIFRLGVLESIFSR